MNEKFVFRVLKLIYDYDIFDMIHWNYDENDSISFFVNCNDVFIWGCSDAENLTVDNIDSFEQAMKDVVEIYPAGIGYSLILWCSRVRKMRPQGAMYHESIPKQLWKLFDECGPEREIDIGNPYTPNGDYAYEEKSDD